MLEKVIPDEKISEIIEELQKATQEARTYNVLMIFKDFSKKNGYDVSINIYTSTGNEYLVFKNKENKMIWNLATCEYCGNEIKEGN